MLDQSTLNYLNTLLLILSTAFVLLVWMYVAFTIWGMFIGAKRENHKDPLENVKFSAVSSLTHIAVIGGFLVIIAMLSMFVFASKSKAITEANTINLKDIIIQVIMLINSVISGLIGFFVRGQVEKTNQENINNTNDYNKTISDSYSNFGRQSDSGSSEPIG